MSEVVIEVKKVSKSFKLPHEKSTGLKQALINFRPGKKYEQQRVLKDISFEIKRGEFYGIVGRNGSGKSTLLKLLAQIYSPEEGGVRVSGSLTPFIELGVGFNPELTGRENVYLNGALLGFDRTQVDDMYDDIVSFAEISNFMDQKLKNYSSGMQVRLAFSIAIRAQSDILLIDEVLAVGDAAFQQKCFSYFDRLKAEGRTIVFVSHDMGAVKQFCTKALLIDKGEIVSEGDPLDISLDYQRLLYANENTAAKADETKIKVQVLDKDNAPKGSFEYGEPINFHIEWPDDYKVGIVGVAIFKGSESIFASNSIDQIDYLGKNEARFSLKPNFGNGRYHFTVGLFGSSAHEVIEFTENREFLVYNQPLKGSHDDEYEGIMYLENSWEETRK